ncbi:DUF4893 domain-containing protein [Sphingomonas sp.]|uniref:DUF4893 domain-containing protein n=1 Tax=Sphingomonas sp. TaxID=28214 RepID=UPI001E18E33A|nr:DUF4893 domain-containing protein [Sphingomonas sp.]MBX9795946.1 DUF4893 domain-containing protein [Sphingomonas sp.]
MAAGRRLRRAALALLIAAPLVAAQEPTRWEQVITPADRERLRGSRDAWIAGLDRARRAAPAAIAEGGELFDPDHAYSDGAMPPAGDYRCRVFKLGAKGTAMADFTAYPDFACRLEARGVLRDFEKLGGQQRPVGRLYPRDAARAIFLGTLALESEEKATRYGRDARRDLVGFIERIGEARWRLVLPRPGFESIIDVIELVPVN